VTTFTTADYVLAAITLAAAIFGLFGGFSGALGFCAGLVAAVVVGKFGYPLLGDYLTTQWAVALATLAAVLLAFGLARALVKRIVKGLLAQPADAIFGGLVSAITGLALALAAMYAARTFGGFTFESNIYTLLMCYL